MRIIHITLFLSAVSSVMGQQILPLESKMILPGDYDWHNQNWDFAQAESGVMLIANGDGLIEYDGHEWEMYKSDLETSILSTAMNKTKDTIFAGAIGEFGYFVRDAFDGYVYHDLSTQLHDTLRNFGHIWYTEHHDNFTTFMSGSYLFIFQNGEFVKHFRAKNIFRGSSKLNDTYFFQDFQNDSYIVNKDLVIEKHHFSDTLDVGAIYKILPFNEDELLIFGQKNCYLHNPVSGSTKPFTTELPYDENAGSLVFSDISQLSDGTFVLAVSKYGLYFMNRYGKVTDHYGLEKLNFNSGINKVFEDESGAVWIATNKGLSILHRNLPFRIMREQDYYTGIGNAFIKHKDRYYLGTNEGVYHFDMPQRVVTPIPPIAIYSFNFLSLEDCLIATSIDGLFRVNDNSVERLSANYSREIIAIERDPEENPALFLSTGKTNFAIQRVNSSFSVDTILYYGNVRDEIIRIVQIPDQKEKDSLYFYAGLITKGLAKIVVDKKLTGAKLSYFSENVGFEQGYMLPSYLKNDIYFFGRNQTALELSNGSFIPSPFFKEVLGSATSYLSAEDSYGNIYLEAHGPLKILTKEEDGYFIDSTTYKGLGLGFLNAIYTDEDCVWLIWEQGTMQLMNTFQQPDNTPLNVIFKAINYGKNGEQLNPYASGTVNIDYEDNDINFRFGSPYFRKNEELSFSFMLEGYDKKFSPWLSDRKAFYTNLPNGSYTFKVRVKNHQDRVSEVLSYSFIIDRPWYKTYWAYLLYFIFGGSLIYTLIQLNAYRLKAANQRLQNLVNKKTAEVKKQNESLRNKNEEIEKQRFELADKNKNIIDSINYAKRIQTALLQSEDQIDSELPEHFVFFQPKDIVSGDFYWARKKIHGTKKHWFVTVGDCTGHGVPGAFLTMLATSFLNEAIIEKDFIQPNEILNDLRQKIIKDLHQGEDNTNKDGMDMALIRIDLNSLELNYAGAFNPLWVVRNNEFIEIKADKFPISYQINAADFTNHTLQLEKGDTIYLFSDGYPDQFGGVKYTKEMLNYGIKQGSSRPEGKKLKSANFKRLLLTIHQLPMQTQKEELFKFLQLWKGELEAVDDICVIGIRV